MEKKEKKLTEKEVKELVKPNPVDLSIDKLESFCGDFETESGYCGEYGSPEDEDDILF